MVVARLALTLPVSPAGAQQFHTDNYLAMPRGMSTTTVTGGTELSGLLVSFSLVTDWEFFVGAFLANEDPDEESLASWSAVLMAKWSFTYSTRAAVYGLVPESAVVGEVYGTEGVTEPQYRVGVRWEGAADVSSRQSPGPRASTGPEAADSNRGSRCSHPGSCAAVGAVMRSAEGPGG
ncbi:MAG TPA: hypothetical protein VK845_07960 [Gemmatimonadales bacterium]|nr:hypothetical protein [Gemmatimonadales bacterium]